MISTVLFGLIGSFATGEHIVLSVVGCTFAAIVINGNINLYHYEIFKPAQLSF